MEINTNQVIDAIMKLNRKGILYVDADGFDGIDYYDLEDYQHHDRERANEIYFLFRDLYENLFLTGVVRKLKLDVFNTTLAFNCFKNEGNGWFLEMYGPDVRVPVEDILLLNEDELLKKHPKFEEYTIESMECEMVFGFRNKYGENMEV